MVTASCLWCRNHLFNPRLVCARGAGHPAAVVLDERILDAQLAWLRGTRVPLASLTAPNSNAPEQPPLCFGIDMLVTSPALQAR